MSDPQFDDRIRIVREAWETVLIDDWKKRQATQSREMREYVYASSDRECVRNMALDLIFPGDRPMPRPAGLESMQRGNEREDDVILRLRRAGKRAEIPFRVIHEQERLTIRDNNGRVVIVGKIDFKLEFEDRVRIPADVKAGRTFDGCTTMEHLLRGRWTRHAPNQLLAYLYGTGEPWGAFVVDRPGFPHFIKVELLPNIERLHDFIERATVAVDARFAWPDAKDKDAVLPQHTDNRELCRTCDHYLKSCTPPTFSFGEGQELVNAPEIADKATELVTLREGANRYKELKKELDDWVKDRCGLESRTLTFGRARANIKVVKAAKPYVVVRWDALGGEE